MASLWTQYVMDDARRPFKYVLAGDSGVGKSTLCQQFVQGRFLKNLDATIGVDFESIDVDVGGHFGALRLHIFDTAGQERFRSVSRSFYRGADCVVLVYDVTDRRSFEHIDGWLEAIYDNTERVLIALVGAKIDLAPKRAVSREEGARKARKAGAQFFELSACEHVDVQRMFHATARALASANVHLTPDRRRLQVRVAPRQRCAC